MNSEQLQDFLTDVSTIVSKNDKSFQKGEEAESVRKFLSKTAQNTLLCIQYMHNNYTDVDLVQPIVAQILALYYKGGLLRQYALQYVPPLIGTYLVALSKKQHKSASIFETFFLAVYNEEILVGGSENEMTKRVEEIRVPSVRYRSVYHDPMKINSLPEIVTMRPGGSPSVQTTVQIGPFPAVERFTMEMKFFILIRIMKSVNAGLCYLSSDAVSRHVCLCTISICHSGFSFPESNLRARVLDNEMSQEVLDDYSRKPRQHISSGLLLELLTGCYLALFNGAPDLALRAIDAVHQRSQYEMFPEVLMVTNSIRNYLLENPLSKENRDQLMWSREKSKDHLKKACVTNASLRIRKMPEDIPVLPDPKEKEHRKIEEFMDDISEGVDHLKKKMHQLSHHHKKKHNNKKEHAASVGNDNVEELELSTIAEEKQMDPVSNGHQLPIVARPKSIEGEQLLSHMTTSETSDSSHLIFPPSHVLHTRSAGALSFGSSDSEEEREHRHNGVEKREGEGNTLSHDGQNRRISEHGSFSLNGFRHMDSGSGTERSN